VLTSCDLHNGSQVGHWVEKSRHPDNSWGLGQLSPVLELFDSLE
jgi:hypothetical protein